MDSMLRRFFSPKFLQSEGGYVPKIPYYENQTFGIGTSPH